MLSFVAEVAPPGPALGEPALAALLALTAVVVLFGAFALRSVLAYALRPVFHGLAWVLSLIKINAWKVHVNIGPWLAKQLLKVEHAVDHYLGGLADGMSGTANRLFHWSNQLVRAFVAQMEGMARDVLWAWQAFRRVALPKLLKALLLTYVGEALLGAKLLRWIARTLAHLAGKALRAIWHRLHSVESHLTHLTRVVYNSGAAAIPHAIPGLRDLVRQAERDLARMRKWLRSARWLLGIGGLAALTAAVLRKAGLQWLMCRNVKKVGKTICRSDAQWIEGLLLDATAVLGVISVVEFARDLQSVEDEAVAILRRFIVEL